MEKLLWENVLRCVALRCVALRCVAWCVPPKEERIEKSSFNNLRFSYTISQFLKESSK